MSLASLQLNPAIAKPTSNGQVQCIVCNLQVKPKIWTAHVNGKKHKESCEKLKQQLAISAKRAIEKSPVQNEAPPKKRMKDSSAPTSTGPLPPDFFDDEPALNIQTPWQKAKEDEAALLRERKGIIEGVPQGFFDDKKKDGMVRETIVNEAHMNEEYERLMRELTEKNVEDEAKAEEEEERDALLRDLDNADEQMEKWMRLNAMEKLKEARLQEAREKTTIGDDDDEGSDDDNADFTNWRAKRVL